MEYNCDLHLHTSESKISGEVFYWKNLIGALKILKQNNIQAFSFSDHDSFNVSFYKQAIDINNKNKLNFIIIPSVEVTIINELGDKAHIIFYFDLNLSDDKLELLCMLIKTNCNREGVKIMKMIEVFQANNFDFALIAHVGKVNYITLNDLQKIKPFIFAVEGNANHPNLKKVLKVEKELQVVLFSDTHTWNKYQSPHQTLNIDNLLNFIRKEK